MLPAATPDACVSPLGASVRVPRTRVKDVTRPGTGKLTVDVGLTISNVNVLVAIVDRLPALSVACASTRYWRSLKRFNATRLNVQFDKLPPLTPCHTRPPEK